MNAETPKPQVRNTSVPRNIDEYIADFPPGIQAILERVRATVREIAPDAGERISYRMPAFFQDGALVYFAAFKKHIGLYPPVHDENLKRDLERYAGPKGNLQFPLAEPIPYELIARVVRARLRENRERRKARVGK
jgi:uncharacterized protein YdhG (YjbR/CyaY superfamily)